MKNKLLKALIIPVLCGCLIIPGVVSHASKVSELQKKADELQKELSIQQSQFVKILTEIDIIEEDIAINQQEIEDTELDLADAQKAEQDQYEAMCKRIQFNYENKEDSLFTIVLTSSSFADFLNQVEYANSVYEYDSVLLDSYEATRIEIEELKNELESQKVALAIKEENLNAKKSELSSLISSTKARKADVDSQLKKAKEEAARRAAAEAAARAAARNSQRAQSNSQSANASVGQNADPAPATGVGGSAVVSFANQFVGNPYVWGGNSLTSGCDCSGFVVQVYKNFGINLGGSRSSAALRGVGKGVSYENMKAGDIVCYSGHVGIYTGAGTIVEAQSTRAGITNSRSVNCKSILAIRRVV